jgi:hypothetical protein
LSNTLGWDLPPANEQLIAAGVPESIVTLELDRIKHLSTSPDVRICQGVEAVRHPGFGIDILTDTLERYLESLPDWVSGVIASWNLLYIPDENLRYLARWLRDHR